MDFQLKKSTLTIKNRVAYVVSHSFPYSSNGYAVRTHGVAAGLVENGFSVIAINKPGQKWAEVNDVTTADFSTHIDGVKYLSLKHPTPSDYKDNAQFTAAAAETLFEAFKVYKPSVVMAASNWQNAEPALLAAKKLGLPFFYEVRGFWELSRASKDPEWQHTAAYAEAVAKETEVAKAADRVITLNPLMRKQLVERGVNAENIVVVSNGVRLLPSIPRVKSAKQSTAAINLGYIGSFSHYEGLEDLINACGLLHKKGIKVTLTLVGSSSVSGVIDGAPKGEETKLSELICSLGLEQHIAIKPRVSNEDISSYYDSVDIIVNPRRSYAVTELVSSLKPIEAAAYGKAILLSDVAPNQLLADECAAAFTLFEKSNVDDLASKLEQLISKPDLLAEAAIAGPKWVAQHRSFKQLVKPLHEEVAARQRPGAIALVPLNKPADNIVQLVAQTKQFEPIELKPGLSWSRPVAELEPHTISVNLNFTDSKDINNKACVVTVSYTDATGKQIAGPYNGLVNSAKVGYFVYVGKEGVNTVKLIPPRNAVTMTLGVQCWNAKQAVYLAAEPEVTNPLAAEELKTVSTSSANETARRSANAVAKPLSQLIVAGILDEFTTECFRHEVKLISPTADNWLELLSKTKPDMLFVESCWFGNANTWSGLIYGYTSNGPNRMDELIKLISYCRKNAIPTVFWAKEDPVHFSRFAPTAKLFDYVFTTDANMVTEYQKQYGIEAQPLAFFCQPQVHNPLQTIARNNKAAFAGSYYSDKKERCENFHTIMDALEQASITTDIYDRCFERGLAHFTFPAKYADKVIGTLKPEDMWKAYKGYRYTVNLNTVKHSPTMFARRVYESLASGTPVISNYSEGVRTQFGGIVCASDKADDILEYIDRLKDQKTYNEIAKLGVREVLGRHTLADRLEQVCERIGINVKPHLPTINAVFNVHTEAELLKAKTLFEQQTCRDKRLVVNLQNANVLYPYMNRSNAEEIYRVETEFSKSLDGISVKLNPDSPLANTYLEDIVIKSQYEVVEL